MLFSERMKKLYYDTVLYDPESVELLVKKLGADRLLFGAECPGVGSAIHPDTGRHLDDVAPSVQSLEIISDADKEKILSGNAKKLFKLDV